MYSNETQANIKNTICIAFTKEKNNTIIGQKFGAKGKSGLKEKKNSRLLV
jgi:hypothetical protein